MILMLQINQDPTTFAVKLPISSINSSLTVSPDSGEFEISPGIFKKEIEITF